MLPNSSHIHSLLIDTLSSVPAEAVCKAAPVIRRSRYSNIHKLLGEHLTEATYVDIVRNHILVDIQGQDVLYQIFTANVLQRKQRKDTTKPCRPQWKKVKFIAS